MLRPSDAPDVQIDACRTRLMLIKRNRRTWVPNDVRQTVTDERWARLMLLMRK